jgi:trehalose/maltose transport system substrate-binding protein
MATDSLAPPWLRTVVAAAALGGGLLAALPAAAVEIALSCGGVGLELALCREGADDWAKRTGNSVRIVSTPNSATERLALYQQLLAGRARDIDVYQIDVVWPGILAANFVDLRPFTGGAESGHFPAIVANNTVDGRLVAMPFYTDAGLLFYRRDLLEAHARPVPRTWDELARTAAAIQAAERDAAARGTGAVSGGHTGTIWGFVFQGRAYEGLTVNALEWIHSEGGGRIVDDDGQVTVDNAASAAALARAGDWVGGIAPPGVLNYAEEEARGLFQSGHAVFMRNWPYAWALANGEDSPVRGKVGVAALPSGSADGSPAAVLGGWNLAVSRHSRHVPEAADLVMHLTGAAEQKRRAIAAAYNPTIPALYDDPDIVAANPFIASLRPVLDAAVARPSRVTGRHYNRVSNAFWSAVHDVLSGAAEPEPALEALAQRLRRLGRRGW